MLGKIKIIVPKELRNKIQKLFKGNSSKVYKKILSLKENPNKGKFLFRLDTLILKELKYESFRFYFIIDGNKLFLFNEDQLEEILIEFLALSKKNDQEKTIKEIKEVLKMLK